MNRGFIGALCLSVTFTLLAGCGGSQPPIGAPGTMAQPATTHTSAHRATSGDLIYATGGCGGTCVASYPEGKLVQSLNVGENGACADGAGNVYIAGGGTALYEFAHGGSTPINTFSVSSGAIIGCSIDPTTGNVATTGGVKDSDVAIFPSAGGLPTTYSIPISTQFAGYDPTGNLFVDGYDPHLQFALYELPKGANQFTQVIINPNIELRPGQVQWDGSYISVEGLGVDHGIKLYQLRVSGSTATVAKTVTFNNVWHAAQSWIQGTTILIPYSQHGSEFKKLVGIWKYPKGGKVVQNIKKFVKPGDLEAVTFSPGS